MSTQHSLTLEHLFSRYIKKSYAFERNVIIEEFPFWGKRKSSIEQEIFAGMKQEGEFLSELKEFTFKLNENKQILKDFIVKLEPQEHIQSYRANYLLGILVIFGLMSTFMSSFIEMMVSSESIINAKALFFLVIFILNIPFIFEAWQRKKSSARVQSFLAIAKSVLQEA